MTIKEPAAQLDASQQRKAHALEQFQQAKTLMMRQFWEIKAQHPDHLLFFRMGDFYELFFEDAEVAAACLDITLTKRGKHADQQVAMCGVPHHAYEVYLAKLIRNGYRVAICEQMEHPAEAKKRGSKSVVKRSVTRVVTAGTLTEDSLLDSRAANYLVALVHKRDSVGVAWADVSTGGFFVGSITLAALPAHLARLNPSELLISEALLGLEDLYDLWAEYQNRISPRPDRLFDARIGEQRLKDVFNVAALDAFGAFAPLEFAAMGALLDYISLTQVDTATRLLPPQKESDGGTMTIDAATRRSLELVRCQNGAEEGSLLHTIDRTVTSAGARTFSADITAPLTDADAIVARQDMVAVFVDDAALRQSTRSALKQTPDMERALTRLSLNRGGPRDLAALRDALLQADCLKELYDDLRTHAPKNMQRAISGLGHFTDLAERLQRALADDLPLLARDGGFIRPGFHDGLDDVRELRDESRRLIAALETRYAELTRIKNLKVRHNNVLGYFVEVTVKHGDKLLCRALAETFIHRQTTANQARFTTTELNELAQNISRAADQAITLELEFFDDLVAAVKARARSLITAAQALAQLDVSSALAELAVERDYCRPRVDTSTAFHIEAGRHPVVEQALTASDAGFVANDCRLSDEQKLWLLTGPNMAGKSTFLRQNALVAIMAHMGSFVPARSAHIGIIDKLFSRVGAADDLARGRSTFMVEMVETAAILNQATDRSLVIIDEIGRGTATFDGLSIAWAAVEHLHDMNRSRALFATHYHELTHLSQQLDHVSCHTLAIREWKDQIVFLHNVLSGAADRSYGIQVAKLAGLPALVIKRAEQVLHTLERDEASSVAAKLTNDLPLFAQSVANIAAESKQALDHPALLALMDLDPDTMSPRDALDALYALKAKLEN